MKLFFIVVVCAILIFGCSNQRQETRIEKPNSTNEQINADDESVLLQSKIVAGTWKIEYDDLNSEQENTGTIEYWIGPEKKFRRDLHFSNSAAGVIEWRTYITEKNVYSCIKNASGWGCKKDGTLDDDAYALGNILWNFPYSQIEYSAAFEKTAEIAGITAKCFKPKLPIPCGSLCGNLSSEYCISDEGAMLYWKAMQDDGSLFAEKKAISYSNQVSDSDFELPAPVKEESG